jgi:predicted secreted protein
MTAAQSFRTVLLVIAVAALVPSMAQAQAPLPSQAVSVNASATASVANDRVQAWVRAEADNADAAAAASQVNAAIAKGLARAKATAGLTAATSGYSTQQITEKGRPLRWRVTQVITITATDFPALAGLLTRLQEQDGLLLTGMVFLLSPTAREQAERTLIQQAIRGWQTRAQIAAAALGFEAWKPGHVTVQSNDAGRVYPTMKAAGMSASADFAPVNVEAGVTEVTVTVSGDAVLDSARPVR